MASMLSKLVIGIVGDPSQFTKGVDVASAKVTDFSGKTRIAFDKMGSSGKGFNAQQFAALEGNIAGAIGSVTTLGIAFDEMGKGTANTSTKLLLVQGSVHALSMGMMVASKVATGFGAALLGTGIGAIVVGLGFLIAKLGETKNALKDVKKASPGRAFLDELIPPTTAPAATEGGWAGWIARHIEALNAPGDVSRARSAMLERVGLRHEALVERAREAERARLEALATPAHDIGETATHLEDTARGIGRTREELVLLDATTARSTILSHGIPAIERPIFDLLTAGIERATAAMVRFDEATRAEGFRTLATRMRDSAATAGMSADATELYRLSLVRVFRIVGGVEVAGTRASTPMEREEEALRGVLANSPRYFAIRARFREEERTAARVAENDRLAARAAEHTRLMGVGEGLLSQTTSAVIGAPSALEMGTIEAQSAVSEAIRIAAGTQTTDEQILDINRRNEDIQRRHLAELERIASILGAAQLVENATEIFR